MTISQRRYVDIASAVVGATAVPTQSQAGRLFTNSPLVGSHEILSFQTAQDVASVFGANAPETKFASAYFAYVTPAPVSRAKEIQFAQMQFSEQSRVVARGKISTLDDIKTNLTSGEITLEGGSVVRIDVGSIEQVNSLAELATELTTEQVTFNYAEGRFSFTMTDENAVVGKVAGLDAIGFGEYAIHSAVSANSLVEVFSHSLDLSDSFFSSAFMNDTQRDIDEIAEVAEFNAGLNVSHQLYFTATKLRYNDMSERLIGTSGVGLVYGEANDSVDLRHLPMAIIAAVNYDLANATTSTMYRQAGVTINNVVADGLTANALDAARVNYYGRTAVYGSKISFYQRGFLCGSESAGHLLDAGVYANEQWLRSYINQQWFTMLLSTRGIPANRDGAGRGNLVLADTVTKALNNGVILPGKDLTTAQKVAVGDASGDELAWHDVQTKGYWYDTKIVEFTGPSGIAEYKMQYVLIYAKGDFVRKVEGSHNLV